MRIWAGIDAGKGHHHCVVINDNGDRLLSRKVANDESEILDLLASVTDLAGDERVVWAVDINRGVSALLITVLAAHKQLLLYIPGRTVFLAARTYRGDQKTDARDAAIIADQARMRRDLQPIAAEDQISTDLRLMTARRTDLVCDRTRSFNRLRAQLAEYFPALERSFKFTESKSALLLLTGYQTPEALRRIGVSRLQAWLLKRGARNTATIAGKAIAAAHAQLTTVPAQHVGAALVARLAADVLTLNDEISELDQQIEDRLREHSSATVLMSMPGIGPTLAAEFVAATGGNVSIFENADRLAGIAGLAPAAKDSGRISGNHHRPRRYDRRLLRIFYLSAATAARCDPASRTFYERKRSEGKSFKQAILALARRRLNVLWAMLREGVEYQPGFTRPPRIAA